MLDEVVISRGRDSYGYSLDADNRWNGPVPRHSIHESGSKTVYSGTKDAYGVRLPYETAEKMRRLQRRDIMTQSNDSVDRNLASAMAELDRMCSLLNLPLSVKEQAAVIYRRALARDLIRGRSIDAFVAASIYAACRFMAVPRSFKLVVEVSKRERREVGLMYRTVLRELNMKPPVNTPFKYLSRISAELNVPREVEIRAAELIREAKDGRRMASKDPVGVAAAGLLLASEVEGCGVVQCVLSKAAGVTGVTLRNRYRDLKKALNIA